MEKTLNVLELTPKILSFEKEYWGTIALLDIKTFHDANVIIV